MCEVLSAIPGTQMETKRMEMMMVKKPQEVGPLELISFWGAGDGGGRDKTEK